MPKEDVRWERPVPKIYYKHYALTFDWDWRLTALRMNSLSWAVSILQLFTLIFISGFPSFVFFCYVSIL